MTQRLQRRQNSENNIPKNVMDVEIFFTIRNECQMFILLLATIFHAQSCLQKFWFPELLDCCSSAVVFLTVVSNRNFNTYLFL